MQINPSFSYEESWTNDYYLKQIMKTFVHLLVKDESGNKFSVVLFNSELHKNINSNKS